LDVPGPVSISGDGRFVVARRRPGGLLVHDRAVRMNQRVAVASHGAPRPRVTLEPVISADGRFVAFTNLALRRIRVGPGNGPRDIFSSFGGDVFVHDRKTGAIELVSTGLDGAPADGSSGSPSISAD